MRAKHVAIGKTAKGHDASSEFASTLIRSSLPLNLNPARVFVMDTAPMPERRRFACSEGPILGFNIRGATHGYIKSGRREWSLPFRAGQLFLMPQYLEFENCWSGPFVVGHIVLAPSLLPTTIEQTLDRDSTHYELLVKDAFDDALLWQLSTSLDRELKTRGEWGRTYSEALICMMAVHILCQYSNRLSAVPMAEGKLSPPVVKRVCDYVHAHLAQDLTLTEIAQEIGLSPYHLAHRFKRSMGRPLRQYIIEQRVAIAKKLIQHGQLSLKEIATQVGFADQSHFTRHFRRYVGVTPAAARKAALSQNQTDPDAIEAKKGLL